MRHRLIVLTIVDAFSTKLVVEVMMWSLIIELLL